MSESLTWNELATIYDRHHPHTPRPARTLPMDEVYEWAVSRPDLFLVDRDSGCLYVPAAYEASRK